MSVPPTLVLVDEDERTIVDLHSRNERAVLESVRPATHTRHEALHNPFRARWRELLAVTMVATSLLTLVFIANQQRSGHDQLLETIAELQRSSRADPPEHAAATPPSAELGVGTIRDHELTRPDSPAASRAELELEAASFVTANDFENALERYRWLSARLPDEQVFSHLVTILRDKLHCTATSGVPGASCD